MKTIYHFHFTTFLNRWFTINFYAVTYLRNAMQITDQGPNPPAVLYLSDGGHIENLGILPLLKKTLKTIVSVDGGRTILDGDYGKSLLRALDLAREKLHCSFLGINGEDVAEDIREKFVERSPGSQPSSYRCVTKVSRHHPQHLFNYLHFKCQTLNFIEI